MRVVRKRDCCEKLGLKESSFDDLRRNDLSFPLAVALGARSIGFIEEEVDAWIASRARVTVGSAGEAATDPLHVAGQPQVPVESGSVGQLAKVQEQRADAAPAERWARVRATRRAAVRSGAEG